jgi:hypothetical protein
MTFKPATWPRKLRSQEWFGGTGRDQIYHRSWMKNQGFPDQAFDGRPVIGICNTWSELTPCNSHLRILAEGVKRGVWEAGGFPGRVSCLFAGRNPDAADSDAVPQPCWPWMSKKRSAPMAWMVWCCLAAATRPRPGS